jgi:hypothetical protein
LIRGNTIGLGADGSTIVANGEDGIRLNGGADTTSVGGSTAGDGNVISGNTTNGIHANGLSGIVDVNGLVIQGNIVGLDATGLLPRGNGQFGMLLDASPGADIGGTATLARNVVSANALYGVYLRHGSTGVTVRGNYVGVNANGVGGAPMGNVATGVGVQDVTGVVVGGTNVAARNVIGNNGIGIRVAGASPGVTSDNNTVQGNYVGVGADGTTPQPNSVGILMENANSNLIGGAAAGAANVIVANTSSGIVMQVGNEPTSNNQVLGNVIGRFGQGNGDVGISVVSNTFSPGVLARNNQIGGLNPGEPNQVKFNGSDGVQIAEADATNNPIRGNQVEGNAGAGINLVNGGNLEIPSPVLGATTANGALHTLVGTIDSGLTCYTNDNCLVDVYLSDGAGQGKSYLTTVPGMVGTSTSGAFSVNLNAQVNNGDTVVATVNDDPSGSSFLNTSEFSNESVVVP